MPPLLFDPAPQISIILCTYNRALYLPRCLNSILEQTYTDWELLIVDDGSQDQTFQVADPYIQKNRNIRYLKHQNRKLAYAKNAGIQASFGHFITFIDSDDAYAPEHLASRIAFMQSHPEIDLIEGGFFSEEEIFVVDYFQPDRVINLRECVLGPTFFGKRSVFWQMRGFHYITYGEDTDFWHRAAQEFRVHRLTEPQTYIYTRAETSITKSVLAERS